MILAVNVLDDQVGGGLGRAKAMAIADVTDGQIQSWQVYDVGWDVLHDAPSGPQSVGGLVTAVNQTPGSTTVDAPVVSGPEAASDHGDHHGDHHHGHHHGSGPHGCGHGAHHARIVRFLREHQVEAVVTGHAGPPMVRTLEAMGLACVMGATGGARQAAQVVSKMLTDSAGAPVAA